MARKPTHPGAVLRNTVLPALDISVSAAAKELGISRQTLHRIMAESAPVTPEMAIRLGKFCGNGPEVWANMQTYYDLHEASKSISVKKIPTHVSAVMS